MAGTTLNTTAVRSVWKLLNKRTSPTTYGEVAKRLGYRGKHANGRFLWQYLWIIGAYCKRKRKPCLNVLVQRKNGEPGEGTVTRNGHSVAQELRALKAQGLSHRLRIPAPAIIAAQWLRLLATR